jgi:hypothetical protein
VLKDQLLSLKQRWSGRKEDVDGKRLRPIDRCGATSTLVFASGTSSSALRRRQTGSVAKFEKIVGRA